MEILQFLGFFILGLLFISFFKKSPFIYAGLIFFCLSFMVAAAQAEIPGKTFFYIGVILISVYSYSELSKGDKLNK